MTLILKLVAALLKDEGGKTPLHEIARRQCMQVPHRPSTACLTGRDSCFRAAVVHDGPNLCLDYVRTMDELRAPIAAVQDFMGFLHIGWDLATIENSDEKDLMSSTPAWEAASKVHLHLLVLLHIGPGIPKSAGLHGSGSTAKGSPCCVVLASH